MLRRRWSVVLLGCLAVLLLVLLALGNFGPDAKTHVATASVLVTGNGSGDVAGGRTSSEFDLDTETRLLTSTDVATRAQAMLKSPEDPSSLASRVTATVPPNTSVLEVSFSADTPEDAQRGARAFANAYLDARQATVAAQVKALRSQVAVIRKDLRRVTGQVAARPTTSPEYEEAVVRQKLLIARITNLNTMLRALSD
jgi:uncharacterized protein involved in exopolysaccharide biosynthesis